MRDQAYVVSFELCSQLTPTELAVFLHAVMPKATDIVIVDEVGEILTYYEAEQNLSAEKLRAMYEKNGPSHG